MEMSMERSINNGRKKSFSFLGKLVFNFFALNTRGHDYWIAERVWSTLEETAKLPSKMAVPFYIPIVNE